MFSVRPAAGRNLLNKLALMGMGPTPVTGESRFSFSCSFAC